jgi:tRNA (guanine-N7-)-methyltransferase
LTPVKRGARRSLMTSTKPGSRPILYGRRRGKKLRPQQTALLTHQLPQLAISEGDSIIDMQSLFVGSVSQLWLEIGFGGGETLVQAACRRPEIGFIGCEPFINGVAKALSLITARQLGNIRLYVGNAATLIDRMPACCLAGVNLFYPDPWPKRRHRERRFISDVTLRHLARVMQVGSELRLVTDMDDYSGWVLARILRSPHFKWRAQSAKEWLQPWVDWTPTRYEQKALQDGRPPAYFVFRRE